MGETMRLICPNCGAQYEVPDEVIPSEGRDVQCSSCSTTWFQAHPNQSDLLFDETDAARPEPVARPPEPVKRELDPQVTDVLHQEAEHERAARDAERKQALESQPDLGLDPPAQDEAGRRAQQARERMARMRGEDIPAEVAVATATANASSRRDLLPDIDEINSTLRSSNDRNRPAQAKDADLPNTAPRQTDKRRGFKRSFLGMIALGAIAVCAYVFGPHVSAQVPAAEPYVAQYTEQVENARAWLSTSVEQGLAWLDQMASENL